MTLYREMMRWSGQTPPELIPRGGLTAHSTIVGALRAADWIAPVSKVDRSSVATEILRVITLNEAAIIESALFFDTT